MVCPSLIVGNVVVRCVGSTIIRGKYNDCVVQNTLVPQSVGDALYVVVQCLNGCYSSIWKYV